MTFVITIALIASIARVPFGAEQSMSFRYKIFSIIFGILIYLTCLSFIKDKNFLKNKISVIAVLISLVFYFESFSNGIESLKGHQIVLVNGLRDWTINNKGLQHPDIKLANKIFI